MIGDVALTHVRGRVGEGQGGEAAGGEGKGGGAAGGGAVGGAGEQGCEGCGSRDPSLSGGRGALS